MSSGALLRDGTLVDNIVGPALGGVGAGLVCILAAVVFCVVRRRAARRQKDSPQLGVEEAGAAELEIAPHRATASSASGSSIYSSVAGFSQASDEYELLAAASLTVDNGETRAADASRQYTSFASARESEPAYGDGNIEL